MVCWKTILTVSVTLLGILLAYRGVKRSLKISTTLEIDKRFNSVEFRKIRNEAAKEIEELLAQNKFDEIYALDEVLDIFEGVAYLITEKAIDEEITWNTFYWWLQRYCIISGNYIEHVRKKDEHRWENLTRLHERMIAKRPIEIDSKEFIRAEKHLIYN